MNDLEQLAEASASTRPRPRAIRRRFWTIGKVRTAKYLALLLVIVAQAAIVAGWFYIDELRDLMGIEPVVVTQASSP